MSVEFQSFVLHTDLKRLWKKAARVEQVTKSEFLRRALRERAAHVLADAQKNSGGKKSSVIQDEVHLSQ